MNDPTPARPIEHEVVTDKQTHLTKEDENKVFIGN